MTRAEMLARSSVRERLDWEALEEIDPWGQRRDDYRAAMGCAVVAWAAGATSLKVSDFMLDFFKIVPPPVLQPQQTTEQLEAEVLRWVKGANIMFAEHRKMNRGV